MKFDTLQKQKKYFDILVWPKEKSYSSLSLHYICYPDEQILYKKISPPITHPWTLRLLEPFHHPTRLWSLFITTPGYGAFNINFNFVSHHIVYFFIYQTYQHIPLFSFCTSALNFVGLQNFVFWLSEILQLKVQIEATMFKPSFQEIPSCKKDLCW